MTQPKNWSFDPVTGPANSHPMNLQDQELKGQPSYGLNDIAQTAVPPTHGPMPSRGNPTGFGPVDPNNVSYAPNDPRAAINVAPTPVPLPYPNPQPGSLTPPDPINMVTNTQNTPNPLTKFFRRPGMSIRLPSNGIFYNQNDVIFNASGEIDVYPLTAADELLLKNPDSLLNGSAIEQVIISCAPAIKKPKTLVTNDLDAVMLAIRVATYGDTLEVAIHCPKCSHKNETDINLENLLSGMTYINHHTLIEVQPNLKVLIKPYDFDCAIKAANAAFEEAKIHQAVLSGNLSDEEKSELLKHSLSKVIDINDELLARAIIKVVADGTEVIDAAHIKEWIKNAPKKDVSKIEDKLKELNKIGVAKNHHFTCANCKHEWDSDVSYDPSNFFAPAS